MLKKLFGTKKEDICPNCGEACFATDTLCPNCGKNLDELFEQLPSEFFQTKSLSSRLKEHNLLIRWILAASISVLLLLYWIIFAPTWRSLKPREAAKHFSGEYFQAFMWSWHLTVNADQTFSLNVWTDLGFESEYTGTIIIEGNNLRLITSDPYFDEPVEYLPIRWGQRRYIIPADMVSEFCNEIAEGWEPRDDVVGGPFYLRDGDWTKSVTGNPILLDRRELCSWPQNEKSLEVRTQHSVQPTSGSRRDFWQFSMPQQDSIFEPCAPPTHLRLTQTVRCFALKTQS